SAPGLCAGIVDLRGVRGPGQETSANQDLAVRKPDREVIRARVQHVSCGVPGSGQRVVEFRAVHPPASVAGDAAGLTAGNQYFAVFQENGLMIIPALAYRAGRSPAGGWLS